MAMAETGCEPPLLDRCEELVCDSSRRCGRQEDRPLDSGGKYGGGGGDGGGGECELPLIDLSGLSCGSEQARAACVAAIAGAASEWGFFQVVNHGISRELLGEMRREQRRLFGMAFQEKATCCCSRLLEGSYRWGSPTATCATQFSWSEAFHIPLSKIYAEEDRDDNGDQFNSLREVMERLAGAMSELAMELAGVLAENLLQVQGAAQQQASGGFPGGSCGRSTCFLRLNRYPRCPFSPGEVFGLVPHTDSDFLTVLYQDDEVGGLQLMKDSEWVAVRPNPDALVVNIGDLFQAWSNDVYKSVEHRVVANGEAERYSVAYFMCPSYDTVVGSSGGGGEPSVYRSFTFGEYRRQVQEDVRRTGQKVGLPRFLRRSRPA